jgi:hypothetical protein
MLLALLAALRHASRERPRPPLWFAPSSLRRMEPPPMLPVRGCRALWHLHARLARAARPAGWRSASPALLASSARVFAPCPKTWCSGTLWLMNTNTRLSVEPTPLEPGGADRSLSAQASAALHGQGTPPVPAPNPSIEGTASGLRPPAAPHVKRWA